MSTREQLLAAIAKYPEEDTPRLAYADWLGNSDESGRYSDPARAEFIKLQIQLSVLPLDDEKARRPLIKRQGELLTENQEKWMREDLGEEQASALLQNTYRTPSDELDSPPFFRRGFIEEVTLNGGDYGRMFRLLRSANLLQGIRASGQNSLNSGHGLMPNPFVLPNVIQQEAGYMADQRGGEPETYEPQLRRQLGRLQRLSLPVLNAHNADGIVDQANNRQTNDLHGLRVLFVEYSVADFPWQQEPLQRLLAASNLRHVYFDIKTANPALQAQLDTHNNAPEAAEGKRMAERIRAEKKEMAEYRAHPERFADAQAPETPSAEARAEEAPAAEVPTPVLAPAAPATEKRRSFISRLAGNEDTYQGRYGI